MISQELIDEIIYISLKKQYIDKELIERIVLDVIDNCDKYTQNLFNGLYFEKTSSNITIAELDENNRIVGDYEEMIRYGDLNEFQSYLERNLKIIGYFLHEIEHLKEDSKKRKVSFESNVITLGSCEYIYEKISRIATKKYYNYKEIETIIDKKYDRFYDKKWALVPAERIAEAKSRLYILRSLIQYPGYDKVFFEEYKNLTKYYINSLKMQYEKRNYNPNNSPLFRFYKSLEADDELNYIIYTAPKLSAEEKMMYGFPITPKDVIEINKLKIKSRS